MKFVCSFRKIICHWICKHIFNFQKLEWLLSLFFPTDTIDIHYFTSQQMVTWNKSRKIDLLKQIKTIKRHFAIQKLVKWHTFVMQAPLFFSSSTHANMGIKNHVPFCMELDPNDILDLMQKIQFNIIYVYIICSSHFQTETANQMDSFLLDVYKWCRLPTSDR